MKIAVLLVDNINSKSVISKYEPKLTPKYYFNLYYKKFTLLDEFFLTKSNSIELLKKIIPKYDVFLNLCDGAKDDDRPGIEVVDFLERNKIPYTGANPSFYEPSREEMKEAAIKSNVLTPKHMFVYDLAELKYFNLNFPVVVKHYCSYSSIGMTEKSLVYEYKSLLEEVSRFVNTFGGALIEEYIKGTECSALVVSVDNNTTFVFDPIEVILPKNEKIKHFNLKWKYFDQIKYRKIADSCLREKIEYSAKKIYENIGGNGYARFDFIINEKKELFFLELNPNCSVFYDPKDPSTADVILSMHNKGYEIFIENILNFANFRVKVQK